MVSREYDYIGGNTAFNPKRSLQEERRRQHKEILEKRRKEQQRSEREAKKTFINNILQIAAIALILGIVTIAVDGKVYRMQNDLTAVKSEIKSAEADYEALRVSLLKVASINEIKNYASEVKMTTPQKDDIISVDLSKDFFANIRE